MATSTGFVYRDPIRYKVGEDLTQERYDDLVVKVADWFREWQKDQKEPAAEARHRIQCCLDGTTLKGVPWYTHWNTSFATRMRMLCLYDIERMEPIRNRKQKSEQRKEKQHQKAKQEKRRAMNERANLVPPRTRKEIGQLAYGDPAHAVLTEKEQETWDKFYQAYTEQFPELRTVNAQGELSFLCDLHVAHERNRLRLLKGEKIEPAAMNDLIKSMVDCKKALGIHPDQLAKRVDEKATGSIADAVRRMEAAGWGREARAQAFLEEMLLLFQMYVTPSPRQDMGGYQLDDIGLFGHTKCRTCVCPQCHQRNYVGIAFDEVKDYLVDKGVLEPLPIEVKSRKELPVLAADIDLTTVEAELDAVADAPDGPDAETGTLD